jgi:tRNA threonylcarbamoyladenosine biosynthesis protein TsaE
MREITSSSEANTRRIGERLGRLLQPGDFITLTGDLGAGKTQFAKGIACGLDVESARYLGSPTYTLMNQYAGRIPLYHFDLYRLHGPDDIVELGFDDYFFGDGVTVVEWADRLGDLMPAERLDIYFYHLSHEGRLIRFEAVSARFDGLLQKLFSPE